MSIQDKYTINQRKLFDAVQRSSNINPYKHESIQRAADAVSTVDNIATAYKHDVQEPHTTTGKALNNLLSLVGIEPTSSLNAVAEGASPSATAQAAASMTSRLVHGTHGFFDDDTDRIVETGRTQNEWWSDKFGGVEIPQLTQEQSQKVADQKKRYEEAIALQKYRDNDLDRKYRLGELDDQGYLQVKEKLDTKIAELNTEDESLKEFMSESARERLKKNTQHSDVALDHEALKDGGGINSHISQFRVRAEQEADPEYMALEAFNKKASEEGNTLDWLSSGGKILLRNIKDHGSELLSNPAALNEFVGEQMPFLLSGLAGGKIGQMLGKTKEAAKTGAMVGVGVSSGADGMRMYGETLREFINTHGRAPTASEKLSLQAQAGAYTALNFVSDNFMLKNLRGSGGSIKEVAIDAVKRIAATGVTEGITEGVQNVFEQAGREHYNFGEIGQSIAAGGIVGGVVTGAATGAPNIATAAAAKTANEAIKKIQQKRADKTDQTEVSQQIDDVAEKLHEMGVKREDLVADMDQLNELKTSLQDEMKTDLYQQDASHKQFVDDLMARTEESIAKTEQMLASMPSEEAINTMGQANEIQSIRNADEYLDKNRRQKPEGDNTQDVFLMARNKSSDELRTEASKQTDPNKANLLNILANIQDMQTVSEEIRTKGNSRNSKPSLQQFISDIGTLVHQPSMRRAAEAKANQLLSFLTGMQNKLNAFQTAYAEAQATGQPQYINNKYEVIDEKTYKADKKAGKTAWVIHTGSGNLVSAVEQDVALIEEAATNIEQLLESTAPTTTAEQQKPSRQRITPTSLKDIDTILSSIETKGNSTVEQLVTDAIAADVTDYADTTHVFQNGVKGTNINQEATVDDVVLVRDVTPENKESILKSIRNGASIYLGKNVTDQDVRAELRKTHKKDKNTGLYKPKATNQQQSTQQQKPQNNQASSQQQNQQQQKPTKNSDKQKYTPGKTKAGTTLIHSITSSTGLIRSRVEALMNEVEQGNKKIAVVGKHAAKYLIQQGYKMTQKSKSGNSTVYLMEYVGIPKEGAKHPSLDYKPNDKGQNILSPIEPNPGLEQVQKLTSHPKAKVLGKATLFLPALVRSYLNKVPSISMDQIQKGDLVIIPEALDMTPEQLLSTIKAITDKGAVAATTHSTAANTGLRNVRKDLSNPDTLTSKGLHRTNTNFGYVYVEDSSSGISTLVNFESVDAVATTVEDTVNINEATAEEVETLQDILNEPPKEAQKPSKKPSKKESKPTPTETTTQEEKQPEKAPKSPLLHIVNGIVNVWAAMKDGNAILSNLYTQSPFEFEFEGEEYVFSSVEHGYQVLKSGSYDSNLDVRYEWAISNGARNIKLVGKRGTKIENNWNIDLMVALMEASFRADPQRMEALLATQGLTITHNSPSGKTDIWTQKFPELLIQLRDKFLQEQPEQIQEEQQQEDIPSLDEANQEQIDLETLESILNELVPATPIVEKEKVIKPPKEPSEAVEEFEASEPLPASFETATEAVESSKASMDAIGVQEEQDKFQEAYEKALTEFQETNDVEHKGLLRKNLAALRSKVNQVRNFFKVKKTVLTSIPNIMENLFKQGDLKEALSKLLEREVTDIDMSAIQNFQEFHEKIRGTVEQALKENTKQGNKNLINGLVQGKGDNAVIAPNLVTAIITGMYTYLAEAGRFGKPTEEDVRNALGMEKDEEVPYKALQILQNAGNLRSLTALQIGEQIYQRLGLKDTKNAAYNDREKFALALGGLAVDIMAQRQWVEVTELDVLDEWELAVATGTESTFQQRYQQQLLEGEKRHGINFYSPLLVETLAAEGALSNPHKHTVYVRPSTELDENYELVSEHEDIVNAINATESSKIIEDIFDGEESVRVPSLKPREFVQEFAKRTTAVIPNSIKEALTKVNSIEWKTRNDLLDAFVGMDKNNMELLSIFLGIPSNQEAHLANVHEQRRDSEKGKFEAKMREFKLITDWHVNRTEEQKNGVFFLTAVLWKNLRFGFKEAINPQSSIFHRQMMAMSSWETTIDPSEGYFKDGKITKYGLWLRAIAEGMEGHTKKFSIEGIPSNKLTVDKVDPEDFLPHMDELVHSEAIQKAAEAFQKVLDKQPLQPADIQAIKEFMETADTDMAAISSLYALAQFHSSNGKPFTSTIGKSSDGINNGPITTYIMLGAFNERTLEQGGLSTKADANVFNNIRNQNDLYEDQAEAEKEAILELSSTRIWKSIIPAIDAISSKYATRSYAKKAVIPFNYSAGIASITRALQAHFREDMQSKLEEMHKLKKANKQEELKAAIDAYNQMVERAIAFNNYIASFDTKKNEKEAKAKAWKLSDKELLEILEAISAIQNPAKGLDKKFLYDRKGDTEVFSRTAGLKMLYDFAQYFSYIPVPKNLVTETTDFLSYRLDHHSSSAIDNVIAGTRAYSSAQGLQRNSDYMQGRAAITTLTSYGFDLFKYHYRRQLALLQQEAEKNKTPITVADMEQFLRDMIPYMPTAMSAQEIELQITKWAKNYSTQLEMAATTVKGFKEVTYFANDTTPSNPGVLVSPLFIQSIDAFVTTLVTSSVDALNQHDANTTSLDDYVSMVQKQNEAYWRAITENSMPVEVLKGVHKVVTNISLTYSPEQITDMLDYLYPAKGKMTAAQVQEEFFGRIKEAAYHLRAAETKRQQGLTTVNQVHQYGGEYGAYIPTQEDKAKLTEIFKETNKYLDLLNSALLDLKYFSSNPPTDISLQEEMAIREKLQKHKEGPFDDTFKNLAFSRIADLMTYNKQSRLSPLLEKLLENVPMNAPTTSIEGITNEVELAMLRENGAVYSFETNTVHYTFNKELALALSLAQAFNRQILEVRESNSNALDSHLQLLQKQVETFIKSRAKGSTAKQVFDALSPEVRDNSVLMAFYILTNPSLLNSAQRTEAKTILDKMKKAVSSIIEEVMVLLGLKSDKAIKFDEMLATTLDSILEVSPSVKFANIENTLDNFVRDNTHSHVSYYLPDFLGKKGPVKAKEIVKRLQEVFEHFPSEINNHYNLWLDFIAENLPEETTVLLINGHYDLQHIPKEARKHAYKALHSGDAYYQRSSNQIVMVNPALIGYSAATIPTLIHELVHAVSVDNLQNKELRNKFERYMEATKKYLKKESKFSDFEYAFQNPEEFLAEVARSRLLSTALYSALPLLGQEIQATISRAVSSEHTTFEDGEFPPNNDVLHMSRRARQDMPSRLFEMMDNNTHPELVEMLEQVVDPYLHLIEPELLNGVTSADMTNWATRTSFGLESKKAEALGFELTDAEQYAMELIQTSLEHFLTENSSSIAARELMNTYKQAVNTLKEEDFYDGDWASATNTDRIIAKVKYNHLFHLAHTQSDPQFLARFAAMAVTSPELKRLLQQKGISLNADQEYTGFEQITRVFNSAIEWMMDVRSSTNRHNDIGDNVRNLVYSLARIQEKNRSQTILDTVEDAYDAVLGSVPSSVPKSIDKALTRLENMKNPFSRALRVARHFELDAVNEALAEVWNGEFKNRELSIIGSIYNELKITTDTQRVMKSMLRMAKALEENRSALITTTESVLYSHFEFPNEMVKDKAFQKVLTNTFLRTNAQELMNIYGSNVLGEFIENKDSLLAEIELYENKVASVSPNNIRVNRARGLAWYMVTGNSSPLLAKNAKAIAEDVGLGLQTSPDPILEEDLEKLISLYAFKYASTLLTAEDKARVLAELKRPKNGITAMMKTHRKLVNASKAVFMESPYNYQMGWLPEITNKYRSIHIAPMTERANEERKGNQFIMEAERDTFDTDQTPMGIFINPDNGMQRIVSGAINISEGSKKGTVIATQDSKDWGKQVSKLQKEAKAILMKASYEPSIEKGSYMVPSYTLDGELNALAYEMNHYGRDSLLDRNNDFGRLLGAMAGKVYDRQTQPKQNEQVVDALIQDYSLNGLKKPNAYVEIGPKAKTERGRQIWNALPYAVQRQIIDKTGYASLNVSNEVMDVIFGYVVPSLASWAEKAENGDKVRLQVAYTFLNTLFNEKGRLRVAQIERAWQDLVSTFKNYIVIRNLHTAVGNITSNVFLLLAHGINPVYALKKIKEATQLGMQYKRDRTQLRIAEGKYAINPTPKLRSEIERLKYALKSNKAAKWIEEHGLLPTIVDDVALVSDNYEYKSPLVESASNWIDKYIPEKATKAVDTLLVAPGTPVYNFLNEATQQGDFIAKYVMMSHYLDNKGYRSEFGSEAENRAAERAHDVFINYDIPLHHHIEFANRMGILMFTKYKLRIQKALFRLLKDKPAHALAYGTLAEYLGANSFLNELAISGDLNPFSFAPLQAVGMFDEPIVMNALLSGTGLK